MAVWLVDTCGQWYQPMVELGPGNWVAGWWLQPDYLLLKLACLLLQKLVSPSAGLRVLMVGVCWPWLGRGAEWCQCLWSSAVPSAGFPSELFAVSKTKLVNLSLMVFFFPPGMISLLHLGALLPV